MKNSIKANFIYSTAYQLMIIVLPLITTPYISRVLGKDGIGTYAYSYSIANYFALFILLGLNNYGNRTIARVRDDKNILKRTFWSIYSMQLLCGILICIAYMTYIVLIAKDKQIAWIFFLYVLSVVLDINWLFSGLEKFKLISLRNTYIKLLSTVAIFVLVKEASDVWKYCLLLACAAMASQVIMWPNAMKLVGLAKITVADIRPHIKPNLILFLTVLATSLFKIMDKIMLGLITTKEQVGLYESSERVIIVPIALITSLGMVMLPYVSNVVANGGNEKSIEIIKKSMKIALFSSSATCFGIMGISNEFVPVFYGSGYELCVTLFAILLPSCIFLAFANVVRTQYLLPNGMDKEYIVSAFIGAGINIVINLLLIPKTGAIGAAWGTLFAEAGVCCFQSYAVRKGLPIKELILDGLPFVISGLFMYILLILIDFTNLGLIGILSKVVIGATSYLVILFILFKLSKLLRGQGN